MFAQSDQNHQNSSITPCAFGGQIGVNRLFPACGTARPGPVMKNMVEGNFAPPSIAGGKKHRKPKTKRGMRRKSTHNLLSKQKGKGGTKKNMRKKTVRKVKKGTRSRK